MKPINTHKSNQRETLLLQFFAIRLKEIVAKYPQTKGMMDDLQADTISLVIDWD